MSRVALAFAFGAMIAVGLPSPGLYLALCLGIVACGCGRIQFARRDLPGSMRIAGAAAITIGALACGLALARVIIVTVAIHHIDRMLPS